MNAREDKPAGPQGILAIVGSTEINEAEASGIIRREIRTHNPRAVVSGGAPGVDTLAKQIAQNEFRLPFIECLPADEKWETGFKPRNLLIAAICTRLTRISRADATTYGSGWTADRAEDMGKSVTRYVL